MSDVILIQWATAGFTAIAAVLWHMSANVRLPDLIQLTLIKQWARLAESRINVFSKHQ
jgi:hypothetical protein